jgi:hypothetical protein
MGAGPGGGPGGDWCDTRVFQGSRRSIRVMQMAPSVAVAIVTANCMPTLNDSTADRDALPLNM